MKMYFKIIMLMVLIISILSLNAQQSLAEGNASSVPESEIFSQPQYYHQRTKYFSEVIEMEGKYKIFHSESEDMFNPLYIPMHKGIRRIGIMPLSQSYNKSLRLSKKVDPIRKAFLERLWNDSQLYSSLKLVNLMSSHINNSSLKQNKSGAAVYEIKRLDDLYKAGYNYYPKIHMQGLAAGLFTPDTYAKYFCGEKDSCQQKHNGNRGIFQWGGAKDEFKAYKVYSDFVEDQVAKIKLWACELNHLFYIVGIAYLGEYDFDKQGFYLNVLAPNKSHKGADYHVYIPQNKRQPVLGANNRLFFPINEEQAEKLSTSHDKLYFTIKAEIYAQGPAVPRKRADAFYAGVTLKYDLVSDIVEFYTDDFLTIKIFESKTSLIK